MNSALTWNFEPVVDTVSVVSAATALRIGIEAKQYVRWTHSDWTSTSQHHWKHSEP